MKRSVKIFLILCIIVSAFAACSSNGSNENISTTAVTDSNGATRFYEPVTDKKGETVTNASGDIVYAKIETQADGKAVKNKKGTYIMKEHTTVFPSAVKNDGRNSAEKSGDSTNTANSNSESQTAADNEMPFKQEENNTSSTTTTKNNAETTATTKQTEKVTQSATDTDGWITKWY